MCLKCSFEVLATSQFFVRQFWQLLMNRDHCSTKAQVFCGKVWLRIKNHLLYYSLDPSTICFNLTVSIRCGYTRGAWQFFNSTWPYLTVGQNSMHTSEVRNSKPYVFRVTILAHIRPFKIRTLTLVVHKVKISLVYTLNTKPHYM